MKTRLLLSLVFAFLLAACNNKMPFTYDIKQKLDQRDLDVKKVQFYNSEKITLRRVLPHNEAMVSEGELKFEDGQYVEEIIIKKATPGVCSKKGDIELFISFEPGENKSIDFRLNPLTKTYDLFVQRRGNEKGRLKYDSLMYVVQPTNNVPRLLIRKNDVYIYKLNQRVLEGQKVTY